MAFFRPKRRKQAFKPLSVAKISARQLSGARCCYQMACGRRTLHQASVSVRMSRGEHRRKAFTLRHPHHRPSCYTYMYPNSVLYAVLLFGCYIVLLYLFTILLVYIVLILDCVGYFHRPKKPLTQSLYTHISECFLLARLRRRINKRYVSSLPCYRLLGSFHIAKSFRTRVAKTQITNFNERNPENLVLFRFQGEIPVPRALPWVRPCSLR